MTNHRSSNLISAVAILTAITLAAPSHGVGDEDVRVWYRLDGDVADASGNGLDGVLPGSGMDPTFVDDAERGLVAEFDGVDDFVDIAASGEFFGERSPGGQLAISFWVRTDGPGGDAAAQNVVMGSESGGGVIEIVGTTSWSGMGDFDGSSFGINSGGGAGSTGYPASAVRGVPDGVLQDGAWHHLFLQWVDPDGTVEGDDSAEAEIWIDGVLAVDANGATSFRGNNNSNAVAALGKGTGSGGGSQEGFRYTGRLSDVLFFSRQLTPLEVTVARSWRGRLFHDGFETGDTSAWSDP